LVLLPRISHDNNEWADSIGNVIGPMGEANQESTQHHKESIDLTRQHHLLELILYTPVGMSIELRLIFIRGCNNTVILNVLTQIFVIKVDFFIKSNLRTFVIIFNLKLV
jgi:hypothetical protein